MPSSSTAAIPARVKTGLLLSELAVSLAERFAPLLTSIALGLTPPPPPPPRPSGGSTLPTTPQEGAVSLTTPGNGSVGGAQRAGAATARAVPAKGGGRGRGTEIEITSAHTAPASGAGETSPSSVLAAARATAGRPVALTCFAAECALGLTSIAALVASSSPAPESAKTTVPAAPAVVVVDDSGEGNTGDRVTAVAEVPAVPVNDILGEGTSEEILTLKIRGLPAGRLAKKKEGEEEERGKDTPAAQEQQETKVGVEEAYNRRRALGVLSALFPASTIPLLGLAEAWLGGGGAGESSAVVGCSASTDGGIGSPFGGLGDGSVYGFGSSSGGGAVTTVGAPVRYGGGRELVVQAVRDLAAVIVSGVGMSRRLQERQAESRRVLERDGLEGEATPPPPTAPPLAQTARYQKLYRN